MLSTPSRWHSAMLQSSPYQTPKPNIACRSMLVNRRCTRKNEMYVAELSDIVKLDNEMIEFEFQKLQGSNTLDRKHCQAFTMSSSHLYAHGSLVVIYANSS
jgi:hypothetical protein